MASNGALCCEQKVLIFHHPGAGTPGNRQWRPPDCPIHGGTSGAGQENTPLWNPDSRIPIVQNPADRPQWEEDDVRAEEKTKQDDAGTGEKPEWEDAETGERRSDGQPKEWSRPEQLTPGENLDGEQGSPETQRLRHVPGGAWLQQLPRQRHPTTRSSAGLQKT
ncbi:hypothetical protein NDU88_004957 [Pleurodeles waltl]|uniref:Uncharacterized protein n=1 Tax=Pleurodeles waltl TaxID=8319 RepID=A0AAV7M8L3_PLEWA|nr:hypothetical protein NDU88_004957 [Pleurodeles waltl]